MQGFSHVFKKQGDYKPIAVIKQMRVSGQSAREPIPKAKYRLLLTKGLNEIS